MMLGPDFRMAAATAGFGLGASCIFSIGPQNLKLIEVGAAHRNAAIVVTIGYLSEIIIVAAGVCGIDASLQTVPSLKLTLQIAGIAFLLWCAVKMFRTKRRSGDWPLADDVPEALMQAVRSMLVVTWLNPLVYVETMLLVGVLSSRFDIVSRPYFAFGFLAASGLRFCGMPFVGRILATRLASIRVRWAFDCIVGSFLLLAAASQAAALA